MIKDNTEEIYTRHVGGTHVPERHDPNCLIVYHHELNLEIEGNPYHFASIIVGRSRENLFEDYRPSIEVTREGSSLGFSTGVFGRHSRKGSILVPNMEFAALAMELHAAPALEEDYIEGENGPCDTLRLLQHWNHFEDLGLSWEDRAIGLGMYGCVSNFLAGFQDECELLGLEFGQKNPYQNRLNALDACLGVLEVENWKRIREIATTALQHAEKRA